MPTYEYECGACGHRFEQFQMMSDPPVKKCPECRKAKVTRLIGAGAGIIFKGSGFYETDYKRKGTSGGESKPAKSEAAAPAAATPAPAATPKDSGKKS